MENQLDNKGIVVLLSGGIDSTTCLAKAVEEVGKDSVVALSFYYGQKHYDEINNAKKVAEHYGVKFVLATIDQQIFSGSDSTLLIGGEDISHTSYADKLNENMLNPIDTYVPFRNGLMLSQAACLAYSHFKDGGSVMYGAHSDDAAGSAYPDCSVDFYTSMEKAINFGTAGKVNALAPFILSNKADVINEGLRLKVPYELTRSCYEGREKSCGTCGTCIDRINAFKQLGKVDPIEYEIELEWGN